MEVNDLVAVIEATIQALRAFGASKKKRGTMTAMVRA